MNINDALAKEYNRGLADGKASAEQKHGHWERVNKKLKTAGEPEAYCSNCGRPVSYYIENNIYHFDKWCAGCGAKMEERCEE